jgi:hypothetical protein
VAAGAHLNDCFIDVVQRLGVAFNVRKRTLPAMGRRRTAGAGPAAVDSKRRRAISKMKGLDRRCFTVGAGSRYPSKAAPYIP